MWGHGLARTVALIEGTTPPPGTIDKGEHAQLVREIEELPDVRRVQSCVVTAMDFTRETRRAQVVVVTAEECAGRVREVLVRFGVRAEWATVEVRRDESATRPVVARG